MEQALLKLEQERTFEPPKLSQVQWNEVSRASQALAEALRQVLAAGGEQKSDDIGVEWLVDLLQTVPSELGHVHLARAIWSAAQLEDEAQQQAALFDALGEGGMDLIFQIAEHLPEISRIRESTLPNGEGASSAATTLSTYVDVEEERRQYLLEEARNAAQVAALAQAEADLADQNGGAGRGTHTVSRKSDLQAQKAAKKAAKKAEQALQAAKDAGAIVDDEDWISLSQSSNAMGSGGLMGQTTEQLQQLQQSLLPEGSRQYYDKQGLPDGTEREYGEGYEMVTIPAILRDESKLHRRLAISEILDNECAKAFKGTTTLNPMQSTVFETAFNSRDNMLVCAPTGAGKTNVALLAAVAHFRDVGLIPGYESRSVETGKKVVYIAPMKALAQEIVEKFNEKLKPTLRLIVRELTGDTQLTRAEAESANILVTTPEKWDVVTRKSGNDENSLGNQCGLLIIDEVHLLADDRGAVIESVVARLHRLVESRQRQVRIVGLSATLPNYRDVAEFLQVPSRGLFFFGPEHRPVPLQQQFIGVIAQTRERWLKEKRMNEICYDIVVDSLRRGYQVMVFVHSRKGTGDTATALTDKAREDSELEQHFVTQGKEGYNGDAYNRYVDRASKSRNREVALHFPNGVGIHHAGMLRGDRKLTEQMFSDGAIKVICCTATLAWGINLPAHTVVIKGTDIYNPEKGGMMDLSILDVQQIFGRAGRPQFDSSGEATLITTHDALPRYLDKLVRAVPIESKFIKQLADHLNAEVVAGTVTTIEEAATWLTYTYLYVRMVRNPLAYGITLDQHADDPGLRGRSRELVEEAAKLLDQNKMLRYHVQSGNLGVVDLGRVAAHFYIQAESVSTFNEKLAHDSSPSDAFLCHVICCASEFENVRIRQEEFGEIDGIIAKACPLKVDQPVHEPSDKAYVLMQAYISRHNIRSFTLISDTNYIASNAGRVARAMFEMCLKRGSVGAAVKLLRIAKSVDRRIWWFQTPLRQFEGELKNQVYAALESKQRGEGYDTFDYTLSLLDMQRGEVGQLCHWQQGGDKIQKLIRMLPYVEVTCAVQPVTSSVLRFHIELHPVWNWQARWHGGAEAFWLLVEDSENNRIYHHEYVIFSRRTHPHSISLDVTIPAFNPLPKQYFIRLMSDSWVGVEQLLPVSFEDIKMPEQKPVNTDLIDLTPLPTSALQEPKYEQLFTKYDTFNPIQTQLFHVLYHSDTPVFVGAPTGSGKTTVAELGILRMKRLHPQGICVYIAPMKSLARERLREWRDRLGTPPLKWNVLELSGDTRHDQKALNKADVLVCTPEKWDLISRGWKGNDSLAIDSNVSNGKEFVKRVRLLVIDEIHLLGEERGAVLEAIVSRTRFISQYMESESGGPEWTRIIGLSTAIANPHDLADWLGIDTKGHSMSANRGLYNFRPSVRPIPMAVHIQGYAGKHYCPRMATMNKPCYASIKQHSPTRPTLIFVASRRQTRLTALDIISYAAADENAKTFLGCSEDFIESVAETIEDEALHHILTFGIGIHHAGLSSNDRDTVERLFLGGQIRVLVATATLAWGVNLPAHFVIVKGTEYFDGKTSRYVDYPLTDVLQMIGRAGRPGFDTSGVAVVMVAEDKKNYYKKFLYSPFPVESCLNEKMCENLNAEISIGTINSIVDGVGYLTWTFYARRVKANPSYYGAKSSTDEGIEDFLLEVVKETLNKLKEHRCVTLEDGDGNDRAVKPTTLGRCASTYYLQYQTPKQMDFGITQARKLITAAIEETEEESKIGSSSNLIPLARAVRVDEISTSWLLYTLASTHEFDELPVRHNEEHLNADLSEDLMWGPDVSAVLNPNQQRAKYANLDVMADPHTK
jgi:activating signal cointegrator complex subunit 3